MKKKILIPLIIAFPILTSCDSKNNTEEQEKQNIYIVGNEDEIGSMGEGTYINTNSTYKDRDGVTWHRNNIFAPRPGESVNDESYQERMGTNSGGNQYGEGYEQGMEDAKSGKDYNPEDYGGNGQFEKGYEDGYEEGS